MYILEGMLKHVWSIPYVRFLVGHMLVNFVVGVSAAIHTSAFDWARVGDFFYRKILPYLLVFAVAEAMGEAAGLGWLSLTAFGLVQLNLITDLAGSLEKLGIPMPEFLMNRGDRIDARLRGDY